MPVSSPGCPRQLTSLKEKMKRIMIRRSPKVAQCLSCLTASTQRTCHEGHGGGFQKMFAKAAYIKLPLAPVLGVRFLIAKEEEQSVLSQGA